MFSFYCWIFKIFFFFLIPCQTVKTDSGVIETEFGQYEIHIYILMFSSQMWQNVVSVFRENSCVFEQWFSEIQQIATDNCVLPLVCQFILYWHLCLKVPWTKATVYSLSLCQQIITMILPLVFCLALSPYEHCG